MSAAPRFELAGAIHHVTNRGPRRAPMFHDDRDRRFFLQRLRVVATRHDWCCLSYCLMPNHVHLVVETLAPTLGAGMRDLQSVHARVFNARNGYEGATVQGRYKSKVVTSDQYLAQLLRYVALNPVKAGLVRSPEEWRWSSHAALLGHSSDPFGNARRVAELLEPWGGDPRTRYARLFDPVGPLAVQFGDADPATWRPSLDVLLATGDVVEGVRAARSHGYRLSEIADRLGVSEATVSRWSHGASRPSRR
jgi:REP element-mobilizing transposase RayT